MKTKITLSAVVLVVCFQQAYAQNPTIVDLKKGLAAYFPFSGNANDESGNRYHAAVHGAKLTADRNGIANKAYRFDGVNDYMLVNNRLPDSEQLTISAWIRPEYDIVAVIFYYAAFFTPGRDTELATRPGLSLYATFTKDDVSSSGTLLVSKVLENRAWSHVAMILGKDGSKIYVNGLPKATSGVVSHNIGYHSNPHIGAANHGLHYEDFFLGDIDDIRIYNRALSADEVKALYDAEKPAEAKQPVFVKKGLVAYYPFNGNAKDESGNGNDGNVKGAVLANDRHSRPDSAYSFDGKDDYLVSEGKLPIKGNEPRTISCWVFAKVQNEGIANILSWGDSVIPNNSIPGGVSEFGLSSNAPFFNAGNSRQVMAKSDLIGQKQWEHLCFVYPESLTESSIYLNGHAVAVQSGSGDSVYSINTSPRTKLKIGVQNLTEPFGGWNQPFDGMIDDIRIYNRALSAREVKALYDLEKPKANNHLLHKPVASKPSARPNYNGARAELIKLLMTGDSKAAWVLGERAPNKIENYKWWVLATLISEAKNQGAYRPQESARLKATITSPTDRQNFADWQRNMAPTVTIISEGKGVRAWISKLTSKNLLPR